MLFKIVCRSESPGGLVKRQIAGPSRQGSWFSRCRENWHSESAPGRCWCWSQGQGASFAFLLHPSNPLHFHTLHLCDALTTATYLHSRGSKFQVGNVKANVTCKRHLSNVAYSQVVLEVLPPPSVLNVAEFHLCLVLITKTFPFKVHLTSLW